MIEFIPKQVDFLKSKPGNIECELTLLNTFINLAEMSYFKPEITYTNKFYKTKCQIVASGILMYKDVAGYRERKTFHVVEADNGNYYLVNLNEQSIEKAGFVEAGGNS